MAKVLRDTYKINGMVIYKKIQSDDINPVSVEYSAVTSIEKKLLYLGMNKAEQLRDKDIIILDSVCTTGGTIRGTYNLLLKAGIPAEQIINATMLFSEGEPRVNIEVEEGRLLPMTCFSHLPIIKNEVKPVSPVPPMTRMRGLCCMKFPYCYLHVR